MSRAPTTGGRGLLLAALLAAALVRPLRAQVDYGLLSQVLREVIAECPPPLEARRDEPLPRVLDLGSAADDYATFLNRTGLVTAHAYDGRRPLPPPDHWVTAPAGWVLCLEVAENIAADKVDAFVRSVGALTGSTLVISWAPPSKCNLGWGSMLGGSGSTNCKEPSATAALFASLAGVHVDEGATRRVRAAADAARFGDGVLVLRKPGAGPPASCPQPRHGERRSAPSPGSGSGPVHVGGLGGGGPQGGGPAGGTAEAARRRLSPEATIADAKARMHRTLGDLLFSPAALNLRP